MALFCIKPRQLNLPIGLHTLHSHQMCRHFGSVRHRRRNTPELLPPSGGRKPCPLSVLHRWAHKSGRMLLETHDKFARATFSDAAGMIEIGSMSWFHCGQRDSGTFRLVQIFHLWTMSSKIQSRLWQCFFFCDNYSFLCIDFKSLVFFFIEFLNFLLIQWCYRGNNASNQVLSIEEVVSRANSNGVKCSVSS